MTRQNESYDVIILGAGAAGLMCALTAGARGRRVLVLEKANKVGKKILMSGGGRCNFTNLDVSADNFISANPHFCKAALSRYSQWDFIALVEQHGIDYEQRKHGQLFCRHSARDILDMLLRECAAVGVEIRTRCDVTGVTPVNGDRRYRVSPGNAGQRLDGESLVVATGALSIPTLGGSGMGYDLAEQFSLPLTERRAGLVPLMFSDATRVLCERLAGVSAPVQVSCNGQQFAESMLFTHRGVSGPAILQISNYWRPGDPISIDLLPGINAAHWLLESKATQGKLRLKTLLNQQLPRSIRAELEALWWPNQGDSPLADVAGKRLQDIGRMLNGWILRPSATEGYRTAEVTLGGVDTAGFSSKTFESNVHPGLYFIGEVLDVTGHLGGFNFQWAWSSGYSAGLVA